MTQPLDPFAQSFDSIEVGNVRARAAFDEAVAIAAPKHSDFGKPGFYLMKDAGGRFIVDRDMGVVTLADAGLVERERGATHQVRLKVVEASGESYELDMTLRITGMVPQMVGAEEFAFGAFDADAPVAPPAPRRAIRFEAYTLGSGAAPAPVGDENAAFGTLLAPPAPAVSLKSAQLQLGCAPPAPAAKHADWTI